MAKPEVTVIADGDRTISIDAETGEILEWPGGIPKLAAIAERAAYAHQQEKRWASVRLAYDAVIKRLAEADGVKTVVTPTGRATVVNKVSEYASGKGFGDWIAIHEPSPADLRALLDAGIQAFSPKALREILGEEESRSLIRLTNSSYVLHSATPETAPVVTHRARPE